MLVGWNVKERCESLDIWQRDQLSGGQKRKRQDVRLRGLEQRRSWETMVKRRRKVRARLK